MNGCLTGVKFIFITERIFGYKIYVPKPTINVFPNPATDFVTFDFEQQSEMAKLELYDLNGKKLIDQQISSGERISLNQVKSGVYVWKITQTQQTFKGKIVIK